MSQTLLDRIRAKGDDFLVVDIRPGEHTEFDDLIQAGLVERHPEGWRATTPPD